MRVVRASTSPFAAFDDVERASRRGSERPRARFRVKASASDDGDEQPAHAARRLLHAELLPDLQRVRADARVQLLELGDARRSWRRSSRTCRRSRRCRSARRASSSRCAWSGRRRRCGGRVRHRAVLASSSVVLAAVEPRADEEDGDRDREQERAPGAAYRRAPARGAALRRSRRGGPDLAREPLGLGAGGGAPVAAASRYA